MIPIQELLHYLGATDADDDILLEMERNAVAFIQAQTHRYFGPVELLEVIIEGDGSRKLWLPEPLVDQTLDESYPGGDSITVGEALIGYDPEEISGFAIRSSGDVATPSRMTHLLRTGGVWGRGYEYSLLYWRGYPAGEEPGDIRQLVLDLCSVKWTLKGNEALKSEEMGGYSYTRFGESDLDAVPGGEYTLCQWKRLVYA